MNWYQRSLLALWWRIQVLTFEDVPPNPATAGVALVITGTGSLVALLGTALEDSPTVKTFMLVGGLCAAITGIGVLLRTLYRGGRWGIRAADGMADLMGDPESGVPGLGDRMERVEGTVDEMKTLLMQISARQDEMYEWHREVLQKAVDGLEPPVEPPDR